MFLILGVVSALYLIHKLFTAVLPHHLLVPSQTWKEKITKVINYPKPIYLDVGSKRSSYRRRLILASTNPSFYTNFRNNKLKINPEDSKDGKNFIREMRRRDIDDPNRRILYGFFHPYANNGGGGERVLWQAVKATLLADDKNICVIYTTNVEAEPLDILHKAEDKFQIDGLDHSRVVFIYLRRFSKLIDGAYWRHFTLIGQLLGAFLLAFEAIFELAPDVWIDTQGLPSSYWLISGSLKIPIMAYTHYPILQSDMFGKLKFQSYRDLTQFNMLKKSDYFGVGKLVYWSLLYYFYVYLGTKINIALANGSWTYDHLSRIWSLNSAYGHTLDILYPPCGTEYLTENVDVSKPRANKMLYLAQFRPEKRHDLLLQEYSQFLKKNYAGVAKPTDEIPTIVYAGSCRTADDTATLKSLQQQVEDLELSEFVTFRVDISYAEVVELLSTCKFGLNAMWNEHFGIGVVEYMARGCIPIVHASAGPLFDIVGGDELENWNTDTGFFFKSYDDPDLDKSIQAKVPSGFVAFDINGRTINYPTFETLLTEIFVIDRSFIADSRLIKVRQNDQQLVKQKFSNKTFNQHWMQYINELDALEKTFREERRSKVEKVF